MVFLLSVGAVVLLILVLSIVGLPLVALVVIAAMVGYLIWMAIRHTFTARPH